MRRKAQRRRPFQVNARPSVSRLEEGSDRPSPAVTAFRAAPFVPTALRPLTAPARSTATGAGALGLTDGGVARVWLMIAGLIGLVLFGTLMAPSRPALLAALLLLLVPLAAL